MREISCPRRAPRRSAFGLGPQRSRRLRRSAYRLEQRVWAGGPACPVSARERRRRDQIEVAPDPPWKSERCWLARYLNRRPSSQSQSDGSVAGPPPQPEPHGAQSLHARHDAPSSTRRFRPPSPKPPPGRRSSQIGRAAGPCQDGTCFSWQFRNHGNIMIFSLGHLIYG